MQPETKKYLLPAAFMLALVFVAMFGAYSGMPTAALSTDVSQAGQQQKKVQTAVEKADPVLPANAVDLRAAVPAELGREVDGAGQNGPFKFITAFWAWISDAKTTNVVIMIFTGVLAWRTHGLFVETGALRAAATEQSRLLARSIDEMAKTTIAAIESNVLTRDIFVTENRPWISVELLPSEDIHIDQDGNLYTAVTLAFKNHGQTPAVGVKFNLEIIDHDREAIHQKQEEMSCRLLSSNKDAATSGFSIFPDSTVEEYRQMVLRPKRHIPTGDLKLDAFLDSFVEAYLIGCVDYAFPLSGRGETRFCYILAKDGPSRMIIGGVGGTIQKADRIIPREKVILKTTIVGNSAA
jgi:hypothetical protein